MVTGQTDLAHAGGHGKDQTQEPGDPGFSLGSASGTAWGVLWERLVVSGLLFPWM